MKKPITKEINQTLIDAIKDEKLEEVTKIIEEYEINSSDQAISETNPLEEAIFKNIVKAIPLLIEAGFNVNLKTKSSKFPLEIAFERKSLEVIKLLLNAKDIEFNYTTHLYGENALFQAARLEMWAMVEELISKNVNFNIKTSTQATILHYLARCPNENIIKNLLPQIANIDEVNSYGETPLFKAAVAGNVKLAELLLNKGAKLDVKNIKGKTPLDIAKEHKDKSIGELFTKYESSDITGSITINLIDATDILESLKKAIEYRDIKSLEDIIKQNEINLDIAVSILGSKSFFEYAIEYHNLEAVSFFINKGADINHSNIPTYNSPLELAFSLRCKPIIERLVKDENINLSKFKDKNALFHSVENQYWDVAKLMIEKTFDVCQLDNKGVSILHYLIEYTNIEILELVLKQSININVQNKFSSTPLHEAVKKGKLDLALLLLKYGAKHDIKDIFGKTPLDLAKGHIKKEVVDFFIDYESKEHLQNLSENIHVILNKHKEELGAEKLSQIILVIDNTSYELKELGNVIDHN
jgi:ankyrin repeat protein